MKTTKVQFDEIQETEVMGVKIKCIVIYSFHYNGKQISILYFNRLLTYDEEEALKEFYRNFIN